MSEIRLKSFAVVLHKFHEGGVVSIEVPWAPNISLHGLSLPLPAPEYTPARGIPGYRTALFVNKDPVLITGSLVAPKEDVLL